jgi:hypothetical protein
MMKFAPKLITIPVKCLWVQHALPRSAICDNIGHRPGPSGNTPSFNSLASYGGNGGVIAIDNGIDGIVDGDGDGEISVVDEDEVFGVDVDVEAVASTLAIDGGDDRDELVVDAAIVDKDNDGVSDNGDDGVSFLVSLPAAFSACFFCLAFNRFF